MTINPFIVGSVLLNFGASIWYFSNGGYKLGLLFLIYSFSNLVFLWLGIQ